MSHYIEAIDKLDQIVDLLVVASLAHETAANKSLSIGVIGDFVIPAIREVQEIVRKVRDGNE